MTTPLIEMTNEAYHADTSRISKSGLDAISQSPAHYYAQYLDPNRVKEPPKKHFIIGSITHTAVLEPNFLERNYFILDDRKVIEQIGGGNPRATTRYKEWKAAELAANQGKQEVHIDEYETILRMRYAVFGHTSARLLLENGMAEQTILFDEPITGAPCKCRPDWLSHRGYVVDLKTTDDASVSSFGKSAYNYRYDVQAPFYLDGVFYNTGQRPTGFMFIAVEKLPPHAVAVYLVDDKTLERGRQKYLANLETYMECLRKGEWPAYGHDVRVLELPAWAH